MAARAVLMLWVSGVVAVTDREACYERIAADAVDAALGMLSEYITSDMVASLLDRAARSSVYDSVVYAMAAARLSEYCMPMDDRQAVVGRVADYQARLDRDLGYDGANNLLD